MEKGRSDRALVTGCAGFVGSHLVDRLLRDGHDVLGVDCLTANYPRAVKERNLASARKHARFAFLELDLSCDSLDTLLDGVDVVYHLAAQPGVRDSFGSTFELYARNNILATQRLLEAAAAHSPRAFVYASSSAVYGDAEHLPASESSRLDPVSPYGVTKAAVETLARVYFQQRGVPVVGLRYFTAYGPRQRPDMAFSRFMAQALARQPIPVFGDGFQRREFTYVADVVEATVRAAERGRPSCVYNVGVGSPVALIEVVELLESLLGRALQVARRPAMRGDARHTHADVSLAAGELGFRATTSLVEGLSQQLEWTLSKTERGAVAA